jgi:endonuclease-3
MNKTKIILGFLERKYGKYIDRSHSNNQGIFELLIGTILSQRTRDENTEKAAEHLFKVARTPRQIAKLPMKKLQALIRVSGPYRQKAKKIKRTTKSILENFNGKVPRTREELMGLYGVGPKTADIVLMYGFNIPSIAIDTHVNRVPKRIGLVDKKSNLEQVKEKLEDIFPRNKWYLINMGFVIFGKEICKPIRPLCIKNKKNCPFSGFCNAYRTKKFSV